jgi:hypothetical protein
MANHRWFVLAVVGVAAIVAIAIWPRPDDHAAPPQPADEQPIAAAGDPTAAPAAAAGAAAVQRDAPRPDEQRWAEAWTDPDDAPVAMDPLTPGAAVLRGRLTVRQQPWQHPAGIEIRLTRSWLDSLVPTRAETVARSPQRDDPRATTDADGVFMIGLLPDPGELFFVIGRGTEWHDVQKVKAVPRTAGTIELGDVLLDLRGSIRGRVVDASGRPVAAAQLRAVDDPLSDAGSAFDELRDARNAGIAGFDPNGTLPSGPMPNWVARRDAFLPFPTTTSNQDGSFELRGLRPGSHDVFAAAASAAATRSGGVLVGAGAVTDLGNLRLEQPRSRQLLVLDERMRPWVGVPIAFVQRPLGFGTPLARTDSRGIVVQHLPSGAEHDLLFGYTDAGPWLLLPQHDDSGSITVERPRALRITLADTAGNPLAGGTVRGYFESAEFRPIDRLLPAGMQPRETAPGEHRCQRAGPIVVVATAPGHAPAVATITAEEREVALTLMPLLSMTVRTRDLDNRPIEGATVRLQVDSDPELRFRGAQWSALANGRAAVGRTDANGEARIPVWGTRITLQASHPDFAPSIGPQFIGRANDRQEILMRQRASVHGRLLLQQRPAPKGYRVRARQVPPGGGDPEAKAWRIEELAVTGDDGSFVFHGLTAGIWELTPELPAIPGVRGASVPRHSFRKQTVQLDDGQQLHCVLEGQQDLMAPPSLIGTVTQNGATIAGAIVRLRPAADVGQRPAVDPERASRRRRRGDDPDQPAAVDERPWTHRCDTDALGDYRFSDLPAGSYELRVDVPRAGRVQRLALASVQIAGGNAPPQPLPIAVKTGTVQLTCTHHGQPVPFRMLRLCQRDAQGNELGGRFEVLLDRLGSVDLEALPSGTWQLEPVHGGRCRPNSIEVGTGQGLSLAIEFEPR